MVVSGTPGLTLLLAATAAAGVGGQAPPKFFPQGFGLSTPIIATAEEVRATYFGWERSTVFGHEVFALSTDQYLADRDAGCFNFYEIYRTGCVDANNVDLGLLQGIPLFGKPLGVTCPVPDPAVDRCLATPLPVVFRWTPGTEIIFALMVDQGQRSFNWFFSGDPSRNVDGLGHLAFFPASQYPDGVPGNRGIGTVPQTAGFSLFGFEDVNYADSDWDFDNSIFALDAHTVGTPNDVVPEPAALSLLAAGLAGLGLLRRWRRGGIPRDV